MYDSSAKLTSGILNGNINLFGDFDQCLSIEAPRSAADSTIAFRGKYCLAYLQTNIPSSTLPKHTYLHKLLQSHSAFLSNFNDVSNLTISQWFILFWETIFHCIKLCIWKYKFITYYSIMVDFMSRINKFHLNAINFFLQQ